MMSDITRGKAFRAQFRAAAWDFASDRSGSAAVEYIVTGVILAVAVVAGVSMLSDAVTNIYQSAITHITGG